ncbi:MAG TPA: UvrD-helicase domain-containing protein [Bacteroidota bacterium]|nr:UvrD-helicase domain-containing protein [Bacteroidota bacterium]
MKLLQDLNPVQQEAVKAANGPVMIVAGAGSGKTRVLTYRIAYLVACGVPPYQILALTFTNKAADEMKSRIIKLVGDQASQLWMGTFHSMFARVLRKEAEKIGYTRTFSIYDSDDSLALVRRCMEELGISAQLIQPTVIRSRISAAKNQLIDPKTYESMVRDMVDEKTGQVYYKYDERLRKSNAMDFDDLLIRPIELFEKHPNVLEKYQERFKFVLVDEFQDTNRAQYQMTKLLGARYKNICVVGDDAQSIYSFRGADIRNILDFAKDYPECQTFRLEQNYRSTKSILKAAGQLIKNNVEQIPKNLWTQNSEGDPIVLFECADDREEGLRITQFIQEEIHRNKRNLRDFAALYRTNSQSRSLEDAFRRAAIPYVIVGGIRFYERKEIKDVLAYLRLLVNPQDEESLLRVINYPVRGIGETTIQRLREFAVVKNLSLTQALAKIDEIPEIGERMRTGVKSFSNLITKYSALRQKMSLSELTRALVDELGILKEFKEEGTIEAMNRWENVQELLSAITEFSDERPEAGLEDFLQEVSLVSDIDTWEGSRNAVTLMTLHASKGLEFPVVFVAGLEEGLLPFYSNTIDRQDLEEERRLFYVGMTRAQVRLVLSYARVRYRFGDLTYTTASRFLSEIGPESLEGHAAAREMPVASRTFGHRNGRGRTSNRNRSLADTESYFEDATPNYESEAQETLEVKKGQLVLHETFGRGKVIEVRGKGDLRKATVQFDDYGLKNLILKFANLKKV